MILYKAASTFHPLLLADIPVVEAKRRLEGLQGSSHFPSAVMDALLAELPALKVAADLFASANSTVKDGTEVHARRSPV